LVRPDRPPNPGWYNFSLQTNHDSQATPGVNVNQREGCKPRSWADRISKHTQSRIKQQTGVTLISLRILHPTPTKHPTYHYNDLINTLDQNWN
jgi:hypothetical protein